MMQRVMQRAMQYIDNAGRGESSIQPEKNVQAEICCPADSIMGTYKRRCVENAAAGATSLVAG